ncbi:uncharacterized protein LOC135823608 [Sycon ciliatum]|uniref:uncharacterized protein LOC135823608 n=1 Tax=Sycon ciliatum TaxID=27933 RepID=UPI0020AB62FB|eukprot:scpid82655/ scgid25755/ 
MNVFARTICRESGAGRQLRCIFTKSKSKSQPALLRKGISDDPSVEDFVFKSYLDKRYRKPQHMVCPDFVSYKQVAAIKAPPDDPEIVVAKPTRDRSGNTISTIQTNYYAARLNAIFGYCSWVLLPMSSVHAFHDTVEGTILMQDFGLFVKGACISTGVGVHFMKTPISSVEACRASGLKACCKRMGMFATI